MSRKKTLLVLRKRHTHRDALALPPAVMKKNKSTAPSRTQFRVLRQICNLIPAHPRQSWRGKRTVVCVKFSKKETARVGKRVRLVHKPLEGEVAAAGAP